MTAATDGGHCSRQHDDIRLIVEGSILEHCSISSLQASTPEVIWQMSCSDLKLRWPHCSRVPDLRSKSLDAQGTSVQQPQLYNVQDQAG